MLKWILVILVMGPNGKVYDLPIRVFDNAAECQEIVARIDEKGTIMREDTSIRDDERSIIFDYEVMCVELGSDETDT